MAKHRLPRAGKSTPKPTKRATAKALTKKRPAKKAPSKTEALVAHAIPDATLSQRRNVAKAVLDDIGVKQSNVNRAEKEAKATGGMNSLAVDVKNRLRKPRGPLSQQMADILKKAR